MKVSADSSPISALGTWLPGTDALPPAEAAQVQAAPADNGNGGRGGQDLAEGLLKLDIWGGASASHSLHTAAPAHPLDAGALDAAVEHIFSPLC